MPADQIEIDTASIFDNVDEHQVEFDAEVDGEELQFAVRYSVLEAISGAPPEDDAEDLFDQYQDVIKDAALSAMSRGDGDRSPIVISENDLDQ